MTQVVIEEKITMANHIKGTFPKNVGKAHPTKTPLNPQRSGSSFLCGIPQEISGNRGHKYTGQSPQATAGLPVT